MKLLSTTVAAALLAPVLLVPNANAEAYGALRVGFNDAEVSAGGGTLSFDQGRSYEVAGGYDMGFFRVEAGASRDTADLGLIGVEGQLTNYSLTGLVDVDGPFGLTLSGGLGVDYSEASANLGFAEPSGEGDGWHYDLAASKTINEGWSVELRRRAYDGEVDLGGGDANLEVVKWTLGAVAHF